MRTLIIVALLVASVAAQGEPTFDVVSIKENLSRDASSRVDVQPGGRVLWRNVSLRSLVGASYQRFSFDGREVVDGPEWTGDLRFDVIAQAPRDVALTSPDGFPGPLFQMVRAMLADRFKVVVREDTRDGAVYTLTRVGPDGPLGPRLRRSSIDCTAVMRDMVAGKRTILPSGRPPCALGGPPGQSVSDGLEMRHLTTGLSSLLGRPIIDRTELVGAFDWELEFAPDSVQPNPNDDPVSAGPPSEKPSIFTALREQLGLSLQPGRGPVEVLVIERAERPTPD